MKNNYNKKLYGAILGDIAGSIYEFSPLTEEFENNLKLHDERGYITDDSLLTIAMADSIINNKNTIDSLIEWTLKYIDNHELAFGTNYKLWAEGEFGNIINNSYGNGCLMRVSPFMWTKDLYGAVNSTKGSHQHYLSISSVARLYGLYYEERKDYKMCRSNVIYKLKNLDESSANTFSFVEQMFYAHIHLSTQELILETIKYNGDCDTHASILGELSNFHNMDLTNNDVEFVRSKLDKYQLDVLDKFNKY